jgi:hypothetical protein
MLGFVLIADLKRLARLVLSFPAKVLAFDAGLQDQHTKIPSRCVMSALSPESGH